MAGTRATQRFHESAAGITVAHHNRLAGSGDAPGGDAPASPGGRVACAPGAAPASARSLS